MGAHQGGRKPLEWVDEGTRALGLRGMRGKGAMMRQVSTNTGENQLFVHWAHE